MVKRVRVKRGRKSTGMTHSDTLKAKGLVDSINSGQECVKAILAENKAMMDELDGLLTAHSIAVCCGDKGQASYVSSPGRSSRVVNVEKYNELVTDNEFYESVKVSISAAKKNLSERELDSISILSAAVPGTPKLVVKAIS